MVFIEEKEIECFVRFQIVRVRVALLYSLFTRNVATMNSVGCLNCL